LRGDQLIVGRRILLHNSITNCTSPFFLYTNSMFKNKPSEDEAIQDDVVTNPAENPENSDLDDSVVSEENASEAIKKLREKLKKVEAERMEYLTGWQRAKADMVNARKREEEDRKSFAKYANEGLIAEIIPVLNSFDMAMGNKEAWEKADKNWRMGVEYIYSQLIKVLKDHGVTEINPVNEKYDHNVHEAVSYEPVEDSALDHKVIKVIQKGYSLTGKVLRAPKVIVGEFKTS